MLESITSLLLSFVSKAIWSVIKHGIMLFIVWGIPLAIVCGIVSYSATVLQPLLAVIICLIIVAVVGTAMVIKSAKITVLAEAIESAGVGRMAMSQIVKHLDTENDEQNFIDKSELSGRLNSAAQNLIGSEEKPSWYHVPKVIASGMSKIAIWGTVSVINFFYSDKEGQINLSNVKDDLSNKIDQKLKDQILTQSNRISFLVCGVVSIVCLALALLIRFVPSPF